MDHLVSSTRTLAARWLEKASPLPRVDGSDEICQVYHLLCQQSPELSVPLNRHPDVLHNMREQLLADAPLSLRFSGKKNSYAILPSLTQSCSRAYTFMMWVKVDRWSTTTETVLFRCVTSHSETLEMLIASDDKTEGRCYCSVRVDAGSRVHCEAGGQLLMSPGQWHLVALVHRCSPYPNPPRAAVFVDGEMFLDRDLDYPFGSSGIECTWTFGSGLNGAISSVALYPREIGSEFIKHISDAGPTCPALDCGVTNPQMSFDTGHSLVGTNFSKLEDHLEAGKSSHLFCFTAHHFSSVSTRSSDSSDTHSGSDLLGTVRWMAFQSPGVLMNGFIELTNDCPIMNLSSVPTCLGDCGVKATDALYPITHLWQAAGGVPLTLYLLCQYCDRSPSIAAAVDGDDTGTEAAGRALDKEADVRETTKSCITACVRLLAALISTSMDMRDTFLQEHGFHVVALALTRIVDSSYFLDKALVDECIGLALSLRQDARAGDGIVSALQGLLFDFSLWSKSKLPVRLYLLQSICDLTPNIGTMLHKAIGMQLILDSIRLHVLESRDMDLAIESADLSCCQRLLTIELEAARHCLDGQRSRIDRSAGLGGAHLAGGGPGGHFDASMSVQPTPSAATVQVLFLEAEVLIRALEETSSNSVAEMVLRCLTYLVYEMPDELEIVLAGSRFCDTTAVYLLCRKGYSSEVRRSVMLIMLWSLRKAHGLLLDDILELCDFMFRKGSAGSVQSSAASPSISVGTDSNAAMQSRRGSVKVLRTAFTADGRRVKELLEVLKTKKIVLQRLWRISCMLSECLARALSAGTWATAAVASEDSSDQACSQNSIPFGSFFEESSAYDMLKQALPAAASPHALSAVGAVVELLKHDGPLGQLDAWLVLPLMSVLSPYLSADTIENLLASLGVVLKTGESQALAFCVLADNMWIKYFVDLAHTGAARLTAKMEASSAISDLSIDALAHVLTYQLLHFGNSAWLSWKAFHSHLRKDPTTNVGSDEILILRRSFGYILQRLCKLTHAFSDEVLSCLSKIIVFVEEKRLCGNELIAVGGGLQEPVGGQQSVDLLDMSEIELSEPQKRQVLMSDDETQLLRQLLNFMLSLRNICQSYPLGECTPFGFSEVKVLQPCIRIILGCLPRVEMAMADAICLELRSVVLHSADRWSFYDPEYYKLFVIDVFGALQSAVRRRDIPADVIERYRTAILTIAHIFLELRRVSLEQSGFLSPHVLPTMDAVGITEGYFDADVVLSLLQKYLDTAHDSLASSKAANEYFGEEDYDWMTPESINFQNNTSAVGLNHGSLDEIISFEDFKEPEVPIPLQESVDLIDLTSVGELPTTQAKVDIRAATTLNDSGVKTSLSSDASRDIFNTSHKFTPALATTGEGVVAADGVPFSDQELYFRDWLRRRRGIIFERLDSSKARLERFKQAKNVSNDATRKAWNRLRRKVESESFFMDHLCTWKLGIAHEGHFPGRRRVVLRPRFLDGENDYKPPRPYVCGEDLQRLVESDDDGEAGEPDTQSPTRFAATSLVSNAGLPRVQSMTGSTDFDTDEMRMLLEMAKSGLKTNVSVANEALAFESVVGNHHPHAHHDISNADQSWGVVDADDNEAGGYGVIGFVTADDTVDGGSAFGHRKGHKAVGMASDEAKGARQHPLKSALEDDKRSMLQLHEEAGDLQFDIVQLENDISQGRVIHTGASLPGTRKVSLNSPVLFDIPVTLITASGNYIGSMCFTSSEIYFISSNIASEGEGHLVDAAAVTLMPDRKIRRRKWLIERISGIYLRTYRLRESALEVFFRRGKHRNFFIDFGSSSADIKKRNAFAKILMQASPQSAMKQWPHSTFYRVLHEHGMQEKWLNGHVSNFEYLMFLNTIAGRSYNDLCQYPVFPWVLSQYTKDTIDLTDPSSYRDLSKPVGALNPSRLKDFIERFKSFGDSEIPAFMYGSHYSTMVGVVLHYLVRLQPFASLHQEIQNGRFDVPDRLFSSIPRTWDHNFNMLSEVKELTPEWFTLPEFLKNVNNFDLGRVQDGSQVGDVELPPWAATAEEFIRINREALEGDFVSAHLHEWIDLIFGYKQRGAAAIEANNVFYYLTYSGSVDRDKLDEVTRKCVDLQIAHFGQCPNQLFGSPHPQKRISNPPVPRPIRKCFKNHNDTMKSKASAHFLLSTNSRMDGFLDAFGADAISLQTSLSNRSNAMFVPTCVEEALVANSCVSVIPGPPTSAVIEIRIALKRIMCIRDNGVVDVLRYSFSESAKSALVLYAKSFPTGQTSARRGSALVNSSLAGSNSVPAKSIASLPTTANSRASSQAASEIISFDAYDSVENKPNEALPAAFVMQEELDHDTSPFMSWTTGDHIVVSAESVISDSVAIPRVPVAHIRPGGNITNNAGSQGFHEMIRSRVQDAHLTHFLRLDTLVLTAGRTDGLVSIRELDPSTGMQLSGADFKGHKFRVTFLSSDSIPNGNSSLISSCDVSGQVLVWTISVSNHQGYNRHIVSRRPQRVFRCFQNDYNCCDISWQMGVVISGSKHCISIFSIERNERFRVVDVRDTIFARLFASSTTKQLTDVPMPPVYNSNTCNQYRLWDSCDGCIVKNIVISDYGTVVVFVDISVGEVPADRRAATSTNNMSSDPFESSTDPDEQKAKTLPVVISFSISGACTGFLSLPSPLTCMSCPGKGGVVIIGMEDGTVSFLSSLNLSVFHSFRPHENCIRLSSSGEVMTARSAPKGPKGQHSLHEIPTSMPASPIISIKVGPKLDRPIIAAISNSMGHLYLVPFPDFVKYEKTHATSAFSQIVNAPIQAVKGTLQTAQNFGIIAGDAAGSLAQNAKGIADDALGEAQNFLKKINKGKLFKGVGSFFGGGSEK